MAPLDELTGAERQAEPSWHPALRFVEPLPGDPPFAPPPSECRPGVRAVGSSVGAIVMGADGRTLRVDEDECYHEIVRTPKQAHLLGEWDRLGLGLGDERTPEQKQAWRAHLWHAHLMNMSGVRARRAPSVARGARPRGQRGRRARRAARRGACRAGPGDPDPDPEPEPEPDDVAGPASLPAEVVC